MMKVTVNFGDEIDDVIQEHLDNGTHVQNYIRQAVRFFNTMRKLEKKGSVIGFGNKDWFRKYNTEVSPEGYLEGKEYSI